jgi:4-diphosphocytidyl-2-C-methyl-D-erythritol kinase
MFISEICDIKLNLTLRVLNKRGDGYHDICSLFWRVRSPEMLEVDFNAERDGLIVTGADIPGENILVKACRHIRGVYGSDFLPPVAIRLRKHLPGGSGVGAGSGNAAAFLRLVSKTLGFGYDEMLPDIASLGADVAFLASGYSLAVAGSVGDALCGIDGSLHLPGMIFFPEWSINTAYAYHVLDEARATGSRTEISHEDDARDEAESILRRLRDGSAVGMIPNDFMACAGHEDQYARLHGLSSLSGAAAWGLCGSGSAYFALFRPDDAADGMKSIFAAIRGNNDKFKWLRQILVLE